MKKRYAYVIGNGDYYKLKPLKGCYNDTNDIQKKLSECNFDVKCFTNIRSRDEFTNVIGEFWFAASLYDIGLFYYSGHGFECHGENYLCPCDTTYYNATECVNITHLLRDIVLDREFTSIVILDCCRQTVNEASRGFGEIKDINPINIGNKGGSFIAFATSAGKDAIEIDEHGVFTKAICKYLHEPIEITYLFRKVRKEVEDNTAYRIEKGKDKQITWDYSSLISDFYFKEPIPSSLSDLITDIQNNKLSFNQIKQIVHDYCKDLEINEEADILKQVFDAIE